MKTIITPVSEAQRKWFVVDANGKVLGRLASEIARRLRGKHKANYCTFLDTGDFVIVVNADKVKLTGNKMDDKMYYRHTGYIGGLKECSARQLLERKPEDLIKKAVWGMLAKGPLGRKHLKKLKVYAGPSHPHTAQQPETLDV